MSSVKGFQPKWLSSQLEWPSPRQAALDLAVLFGLQSLSSAHKACLVGNILGLIDDERLEFLN
jgi:hypothetical protein